MIMMKIKTRQAINFKLFKVILYVNQNVNQNEG